MLFNLFTENRRKNNEYLCNVLYDTTFIYNANSQKTRSRGELS